MAVIPGENIQPREVVPFLDMEFTPKEKKQTVEYSRDIAKSVYSYYVNNKTELSWDYSTKIDELRLIGSGRQSPDYYKRYYSGNTDNTAVGIMTEVETYFTNSAEANRYGWMNVIWDNLSPIANVKQIAKSLVRRADFDVRASIIDVNSNDDEDRRMIRHYAMAKYKAMFDFLRGKWGLPMSQESFISDQYNDLLEIKQQGGFKAHYVLGIEQILKWTEQYSDWDDHLKERFFEDLFDVRYAFACVKYDDISYKPKWHWIDVKDVVIQSSRRHDFSDTDYRGYFEYPTINELRAQGESITDGKKTKLTKDDWRQIGMQYAEYFGNPNRQEWSRVEMNEYGFDGKAGSTRVCVLHVYWRDYEKEYEVEFENQYGGKKRRSYKEGEKVSENDKLVTSRIEKIYYCSWIVGTDYVFNYGAMDNMPRKNLREAMFPVIGVKLMEKSYTERLAPLAHMFAIAWIRLCNAIAKAQNDGYAIDINALATIDDGQKKMKWDDIIQMFREENVFLWDSSKQGGPMSGSGLPIQKIQGTLLEDMTKELALMDQMYAKIEQLIGLPPVALGVMPKGGEPVRTTQMSVSSSNTALDLLVASLMKGKKGLAEVSCSMWQNAIKYSDQARKEASRVIGSDDVQAIQDARDEFMEYGIELNPRPSQELIQEFFRLIEVEIGRKNQGLSGIDSIEAMWLRYHLEVGGNFQEALFRLTYLKKQDEKRLQAEKQAAIQQQGQMNIQAAQAQGEEERKTEAMKSQQAQRDSASKAIYDGLTEDKKFNNKIKEMRAQWKMDQGKDPLTDIDQLERQLQMNASKMGL